MPNNSQYLLEKFISLHPKIIDLSLGRVHDLLARLDHPEEKLPPVIHIAGTNGKGSVLAFLREILSQAGFKTHSYISPHLVNFHERITLAGEVIREDTLYELLKYVDEVNQSRPITFFEITSCAAFLAFSQTKADILFLETGLGGRLDATNVIKQPLASIITPIGMDHQQYLGDTIEKIAYEKAHIQKQFCPSIIAKQQPDAMKILKEQANEIGAIPHIYGQDWHYDIDEMDEHKRKGFTFHFTHHEAERYPAPALLGVHQYDNAATAIATAHIVNERYFKKIGRPISHSAMKAGIANASWPARMQILKDTKWHKDFKYCDVILDGGHNPAAAKAICDTLGIDKSKPLFMLVGMLNTKHADEFIQEFSPHCDAMMTITIPHQDNSFSNMELAKMAQQQGIDNISPLNDIDDMAPALRHHLSQNGLHPNSPFTLLITGSLYLAGYILGQEIK